SPFGTVLFEVPIARTAKISFTTTALLILMTRAFIPNLFGESSYTLFLWTELKTLLNRISMNKEESLNRYLISPVTKDRSLLQRYMKMQRRKINITNMILCMITAQQD